MKDYEKYMRGLDYTVNTQKSYIVGINNFYKLYDEVNIDNLKSYKHHLIEKYSISTVNSRIVAMNSYLDFINFKSYRIKTVKTIKKNFLENVISNEDYTFILNSLLEDLNYKWYFIIKFIANTGSRVSELVEIKHEHLHVGYMDIYSKGGKVRRVYIPKKLIEEYYDYNAIKKSGYLFINKSGVKLSTRGISLQLKIIARKYKVNAKVVYPHSFRHLFAKNFVNNYKDIALLADLLGHSSIETTRIYLRRTSEEQYSIVNEVVTW